MASQVDSVLKRVGEAVTIIRTGGNVSTYFYMSPKGSTERSAPYERNVMMPSDSGVVEGDLISHLSDYYLVVSAYQDRRVGQFFYNKVRLYRCNSTVTVRAQNPTTKLFVDAKTGVHCLITQVASTGTEDRGLVVPRYTGKDRLFDCFLPTSVGITKNNILVGADGKQFRVMEDINPFVAQGVTLAMLKWENA